MLQRTKSRRNRIHTAANGHAGPALAACLGLALLAGCGGNEQPSTATEPPAGTAVPAATGAATAPTVAAETGGMTLGGAAEAGAALTETAAAPAVGDSEAGALPADQPAGAPAGDASSSAAASGDSGGGTAGMVLEVGATFTATAEAAVYAEPDTAALRYAVYPAGATFVVVEPGGDYTTYPVVAGGVDWRRVRAPDGLVGWVAEATAER